jgi:hypothetical protein
MAKPLQGRPLALAVVSDRQLANESLTLQGIEIPRPDKSEEPHGAQPKNRGRHNLSASIELA